MPSGTCSSRPPADRRRVRRCGGDEDSGWSPPPPLSQSGDSGWNTPPPELLLLLLLLLVSGGDQTESRLQPDCDSDCEPAAIAPGDPKALAAAIKRLMETPKSEREAMANRAIELAHSIYSRQRINAEYNALLREVIAA